MTDENQTQIYYKCRYFILKLVRVCDGIESNLKPH